MAVDYKTNPGVFNKSVILLKEYITFDEYDTEVSRWHPIARVQAAIEPMSGRDYWNASHVQAESSVRITIRYRDDVSSRMRVRYDVQRSNGKVETNLYELKSPPINYNEADEYLELMCARFGQESEVIQGEKDA